MSESMTLTIGTCRVDKVAVSSDRWWFDGTKRAMDLILGSIALILLSPVMILCGLIVRISSRGPILYRQTRIGKDGKLFEMYKLRTMYDDAEAGTGAVWASDNDPRVVWTCRWMRRAHLDELPQLFNVLKGEMSLVGPRPERPEITAQLEKVYPNIYHRLVVRPGITGLSQIRNGYDKTIESVRRKFDADMEYIHNRKWSLELRILAATLPKFYDRSAH